MRYGEDYKTPCEKFAIDTLNDAATKHGAQEFFSQQEVISMAMQQSLNTTLEVECFISLTDFQLQDIELPDKFERAISQTQIRD